MAVSDIFIVGAGPAGLTAAYMLARQGITGTIVESDTVVGGIARTVQRDGYRFDIGGHRFFTKVESLDKLWSEILGETMLVRPRLSRIYFAGSFYDYPLRPLNALKNMGPATAVACVLSYIRSRIKPIDNPVNFEQWVTNAFGARLFRMFFKSYTEKVWGRPCASIGADWASQRIKGLDLGKAILSAFFKKKASRAGGSKIKTLIDEFKYPRLGPGQLWEACASKAVNAGWALSMSTRVSTLDWGEDGIVSVRTADALGNTSDHIVKQVISSMPLRELVHVLRPSPPPEIVAAAAELKYRDFLTVALVLDKPDVFPDNWLYIHSPDVRVGRIQNFGNWSPEMLATPDTSCLGMEYFVFEHDELWNSDDDALIRIAFEELRRLGLTGEAALVRGYVIRMPKAYPVYDTDYKTNLDQIRGWLSSNIRNLQCVGRNGQHRYNNQDHSMATAIIAATNISTQSEETRDPWSVNEDAEYHEIARTERQTPAFAPVAEPATPVPRVRRIPFAPSHGRRALATLAAAIALLLCGNGYYFRYGLPEVLGNHASLTFTSPTTAQLQGKKGELVFANFSLRNNGNRDVTVLGLNTSCGCLSMSDLPQVVKAGGTTSLSLRVMVDDPNSGNDFVRSATLFTDEGGAFPRLSVRVNVLGN